MFLLLHQQVKGSRAIDMSMPLWYAPTPLLQLECKNCLMFLYFKHRTLLECTEKKAPLACLLAVLQGLNLCSSECLGRLKGIWPLLQQHVPWLQFSMLWAMCSKSILLSLSPFSGIAWIISKITGIWSPDALCGCSHSVQIRSKNINSTEYWCICVSFW